STGMNDLNSKMQQWINQVSNGFSGSQADASSATQYTCDLDGQDYPVLSPGANERGSNAKCVFLGKAIQVNTADGSNDKISAYSVLGRRVYTPAASTETLVDNIYHANPVAAVFPPGNNPDIDLTEVYTIPNGIIVKSITSTSPVSDSHMAGFYTTFNNGGTSNGSQGVMTIQYPFNTNVDPRDSTALDCIKFLVPCNNPTPQDSPWPLQDWKLCLASTRNSDTATLTISSAQGRGAVTKLDFSGC